MQEALAAIHASGIYLTLSVHRCLDPAISVAAALPFLMVLLCLNDLQHFYFARLILHEALIESSILIPLATSKTRSRTCMNSYDRSALHELRSLQ